jgi:probable F420-dependent oxidoreductase
MKFGVVIPIWRLTMADAERITLRAEELGWDGVFVPDHIMAKPATTQHYGPTWPDPFALLAFLAGRTRQIQVGASVIVLPYRNPLVAAKSAATVDQVSGGRFICGIGVGWDEAEFKDLGLPFRERGAMTDEYLKIMKTAWAADMPEYAGRYMSFSGATFSPRPRQAPNPPLVGGRRARRALRARDAAGGHPLRRLASARARLGRSRERNGHGEGAGQERGPARGGGALLPPQWAGAGRQGGPGARAL